MSKLSDKFVLAAANGFLYAANHRRVRHYRRLFGRRPNIANPQTYSERMLWRKLVDHNPQFVVFCDKLATKEFMRRRCPNLPQAKVRWVGQDAEAIPDEVLRGDVFVKASHGCDFNHRIRGGKYDRAVLREKTRRWLGSVYGVGSGQWAYSQVKPQLFVEEAVGDAEGDLIEFDVRASNGIPLLGSIVGKCKTPAQWRVYVDPAGVPTRGMEDLEDSPLKSLPSELALEGPYRRAVQFAKTLSAGLDYARFDFMWNGRELFGGEITVYPAAGNTEPANAAANALTLSGWDLRHSHFAKVQHNGWKKCYADALKRRWTEQNP